MTARLPDVIKETQGTLRPSRVNASQPRPPSMELGADPPAWLQGAKRRRAWSELVRLLTDNRVLTSMDPIALGLLCDTFGDYLEASDLLNGKRCAHCGRPNHSKATVGCVDPMPGQPFYTTTTKDGSLMIRPHPAVTVRKDARMALERMLTRFGMDPSSRARIVTSGDGEDIDPDEAYFRGTES